MVYIIQEQKHTHKKHVNQLKKRHEMDSNNTQDEVEEPIQVIYDTINLEPHSTHFRTTKIEEEEEIHRTLIYRSKTEEILMERINLLKAKGFGSGCWGVSPTDGLALMWHILVKLSSAQSRSRHEEQTLIFMIVLSWGEVSPSYRLRMYYFLSIYFLSLISESCYHLNLPLTITKRKQKYNPRLF